MREALVLCGGTARRKHGAQSILRLDVAADAEPDQRVKLQLERLQRRLVDDIPATLSDVVEVAAYVYAADRLIGRGRPELDRMGADWRRNFRFVIPVRRPEIWSRADVLAALSSTLSFLTEDEFAFEFTQKADEIGLEPYLGFRDSEAHIVVPDEAALFSGGLDSLSGAVTLLTAGKKVALVTHQSSTLVANRQNALVAALERRFPGQTYYVPVWLRKGEQEPVEHTQRSRSFWFATLAFLIPHMFGRQHALFFENGITSFNLPLATHVLGTRASRTTHPRVLRDFAHLFSLLLGRPFAFDNPFLWKTKGEVVRTLEDAGLGELIPATTSCAHVRDLSMSSLQCGKCSQCVERRLAVAAAGLESRDPDSGYAVDVFRDDQADAAGLTMAAEHVLRSRRLARMGAGTRPL